MRKLSIKKIILVVVILLLLFGASVFAWTTITYNNGVKPVSSSTTPVIFVVDEGATFKAVGERLEEKKLIRSARVFDWYVKRNSPDTIKAGAYKLNQSMSLSEIMTVLTGGKVATDLVTILPGKRIDQVRAELIRAGFAETDVKQALNPSLFGSHQVFAGMNLPDTLEGFVYPESFVISSGTSAEEVVGLALDEMDKALTREVRAGINKQGLTVYEGIILASIVEREVSSTKPADRAQVAQVFLNRLKIGMALESDATAVYGAVLDNAITDSTTRQEILHYSSPYNTYENKGLPPAPISNVSASSLQAVANPASTDYLFFVAGQDCVTRFSKTLDQHEALIKQYGVGADCQG